MLKIKSGCRILYVLALLAACNNKPEQAAGPQAARDPRGGGECGNTSAEVYGYIQNG